MRVFPRVRDGLLAGAVLLAAIGPGVSAALNPGWHRGWFGGLDLVLFVIAALGVGFLASGIAVAPPSRWAALRRAAIAWGGGVVVLAPLALFGFRLVRGLPLTPYSHGCGSGSPAHVMGLAMVVMPAAAFLLGMAAAVSLRFAWDKMTPPSRPWWLRGAIVCALGGAAFLLALPLVIHSPQTCLAVFSAVALAPWLAGDRALSLATLATLAVTTLLGFYV